MANSQAYRSYKTQLNKLFDGGAELPDALKEKLQDSGMVEAAKAKKAATEKVLEAMSPRKLRKAFKAYRGEYGFPEDSAMINKLLESDDEDLLVETMETIDHLVAEGELKAGSAMKARIKSAMILVDAYFFDVVIFEKMCIRCWQMILHVYDVRLDCQSADKPTFARSYIYLTQFHLGIRRFQNKGQVLKFLT